MNPGRLLRPLPRGAARAGSLLVLLAWIVTMAVVFSRTFAQARSMNLATDLARYGTAAEWRGVYYRGEKVGFTVSQTSPSGDGFEVREDAQRAYNAELDRMTSETVWVSGGCTSYYIDRNGHNSALWPTFTWPFRRRLREFDAAAYALGARAPAGVGEPKRAPAAV